MPKQAKFFRELKTIKATKNETNKKRTVSVRFFMPSARSLNLQTATVFSQIMPSASAALY